MSGGEVTRTRGGIRFTLQIRTAVDLTPHDLARAFCEMDAEQQAQFFSDVDRFMRAWKEPASAPMQRYAIANAIKSCNMQGARYWIEDLASDLEDVK